MTSKILQIFPNKLKARDEVRVIAPASSMKIVSKANCDYAKSRIEQMGLKVTFGKHVNEEDMLQSSSLQSRLEDLHEAFQIPRSKLSSLSSGVQIPIIYYSISIMNSSKKIPKYSVVFLISQHFKMPYFRKQDW